MNRLANYLIATVLRATALVAFALVTVASVIEFVGQLDDVGLAAYGVREALTFVALRIPHKLFDVLPAATLIGALLGLGNLAVHRELVVMRASGVSQLRLLAIVGTAGLILFVVMALLGESLAPKLGNYARTLRAEALLEDVDTASAQSSWLREGDDYVINLRQPAAGEDPGQQFRLFELDGDTGLRRVIEGELVSAVRPELWDMLGYAETSFGPDGTSTRNEPRFQQDFGFGREVFEFTQRPPDMFELPELVRHIRYLEDRNLDASTYRAVYWGRIANGTSVVLMAMLALPFVLGGLRSAGAGARMIIGLVIGLGYYVLGELSANTGEVFALDPLVAAWAPTGVLLLVTALAVLRFR